MSVGWYAISTGGVGLDQSQLVNYASQATGRLSQQKDNSITSVLGPSAVPEPSSLLLATGGLMTLLAARRIRG